MEKAIEFSDLTKCYRTKTEERHALKGLSLAVESGQIFGFAGPNGAGKSTAIKILIGLVQATSGTASIFGHPSGSREGRALLGFLPEVTLYHEFMGAEELLRIHAHLSGLPKAEHSSRCREVLEQVGLWERRKSRIKEFSKGMKQKFGIAQALLGRPRLLVLDELTSGLDPTAQYNLLMLLKELKDQGYTIFFSSHHLEEIERVCDAAAIIHLGELKAAGTLAELLGLGVKASLRVAFSDGWPEGESSEGWTLDQASGAFQKIVLRTEVGAQLDRVRALGGEILEVTKSADSLERLFHRLTSDKIGAQAS